MFSSRTGRLFLALLASIVLCANVAVAADTGTLNIHVDRPGAKIGPLFYGLMTEEINHSYDGGLYAELIQNRIFKDNAGEAVHWSVVKSEGAEGSIALDSSDPVNTVALTTSLRLDVTNVGANQRVGVANDGYWGIPVWPNTKYHASFYARANDAFSGPLTVSIESNDGETTYASGTVSAIGTGWKKYEVDLTTGPVEKSSSNRFVISAGSKGTVWFSLVSLFPPTYKNRANGNRIDIMEKLAGLHPKFLRFPGGNFLEGNTIEERFDWKKTIGPLEQRPGHPCCWGYYASDGLGLLEFLEWCEDLHMEPLLAVYAGYSLQGAHVNPGPDLEPFVQEALEEIEYCTGDVTTKWGKRRAEDGHPAPFVIHYIEIGNEDFFDRSGSYDGRFAQIFDAIKAKYPNLQCISTTQVTSRKPDLQDDHDYPGVRQMLAGVNRYQDRDPNLPKIFFGEWATQDGRPTPTMRAALADAAWLTGLQNKADTVLMNCYAPLFVNVNPNASQWGTNLIGYDAATSFGSPSYYAQAMFNRNLGDTVVTTELDASAVTLPAMALHGGVGVGTWATQSEYKDIRVTKGDKVLYRSDFTRGTNGWKLGNGDWRVVGGALRQSSDRTDCRAVFAGDPSWANYTYTLKARKTGGREGFLILFSVADDDNLFWWNLGGWDNTRSAIRDAYDGHDRNFSDSHVTIDTGKWYDVRIEVDGRHVKCSLDGKVISDVTIEQAKPVPALYATASKVDATGEVILKVANAGGTAQPLTVNLSGVQGVEKNASVEFLTGQPGDVNSVESPEKVVPQTAEITDAGTSFVHEFPAYSVSVIKLKTH